MGGEWTQLPKALWLEISRHLNNTIDILLAQSICKDWYEACQASQIWQARIERDFGVFLQRNPLMKHIYLQPNCDFKKTYIAIFQAYRKHLKKELFWAERWIRSTQESSSKSVPGNIQLACRTGVILSFDDFKQARNFLAVAHLFEEVFDQINLNALSDIIKWPNIDNTILIQYLNIDLQGKLSRMLAFKLDQNFFQNLVQLDLKTSVLTEIPDAIFELINLKILDMSWNAIFSIPKKIENLQKLTKLCLSNNAFFEFPIHILSLTNLVTLSLGNELDKLNLKCDTIVHGGAQVLSADDEENLFQVYFNKITTLPAEIAKLQKLKFLDLGNLNLTSLPQELSNIVMIRHLNICNNYITKIPETILRDCPNLSILCNHTPIWRELALRTIDNFKKYKQFNIIEIDGAKLSNNYQICYSSKDSLHLMHNAKYNENEKMQKNIPDLPIDTWVQILMYLEKTDEILQMAFISKKIHKALHSEILWHYLIERDLAHFLQERPYLQYIILRENNKTMRQKYIDIFCAYQAEMKQEFNWIVNKFHITGLCQWSELDKRFYIRYDNKVIKFNDVSRSANLLNRRDEIEKTFIKINELIEDASYRGLRFYQFQGNQHTVEGWIKCQNHRTRVREIDFSFFSNYTMVMLTLQTGVLRTVPLPILKITSLKKLDLSWNSLWHLPEEIKNLNELICLNLSNNLFMEFPEAVLGLPKLKVLNLENNISYTANSCPIKIYPGPQVLLEEDNIKHKFYAINYNHIRVIPETICKLVYLKSLFLNNTNLEILPDTMGQLTNLKFLFIFQNHVQNIPDSVLKLPALKIQCDHNPVWHKLFSLALIFNKNKQANNDKAFRVKSAGAILCLDHLDATSNPKLSIKMHGILNWFGFKSHSAKHIDPPTGEEIRAQLRRQ